jgi:CubicO group peptidase (beta-lactamase class C family)
MKAGALSKVRLDRMHAVMAGYVERGEVPGLVTLVSRRGEVYVEAIGVQALEGSEPMGRETIFRIASLTKPIVAAATMILVEECTVRLDEPVDRLLPELAGRRVLTRLDGPLDDTVAAKRPISVRDLLTFRLGYGYIAGAPGDAPIVRAMVEAGLAPGPELPRYPSDEWIRRLAALPLAHQPGEQWLYHTGSDALGVLIARASGQPLETFLRERIFEPLGMKDTAFSVPAGKLGRLASCYKTNPEAGALEFFDDARDSRWSRPPAFPSGGGGLVSTIDDYLAFGQMLLGNGRLGRERILSRPSVETMTTDQLTPEQRASAELFLGGNSGWGFGLAVVTRRDGLAAVPGRYGWNGGYGTSWSSDPQEEMVGILMTQVVWTSASGPGVYHDFWTSAYQAIDD